MSKKHPKTGRGDKLHNQELEQLRAKNKELESQVDQLKRALADLENYRKRMEAEKADRVEFAKADFIVNRLAPVIDNFARALQNVPEDAQDSPWVQGILRIKQQLEDVLDYEGLERIPTKDKVFDHNLHEAVTYEDDGLPANHIIEEIQSGWTFNGKVVKTARVRVSRGPDHDTKE